MRDEGFPLSRTSIAIRAPRCARTAEDANVEQAEVVQVLDRSEQLQNLVAAITGLSTGMVKGKTTSSAGSSTRNFCFRARCRMARTLLKAW